MLKLMNLCSGKGQFHFFTVAISYILSYFAENITGVDTVASYTSSGAHDLNFGLGLLNWV